MFPLQDAAGCRKVRDLQWLVMDVVGENEALQQFFEGKSLVLRVSTICCGSKNTPIEMN